LKGSTVLITTEDKSEIAIPTTVDFTSVLWRIRSVLVVNGAENENYVAAIQHVRRRETVAMTPANLLIALQLLLQKKLLQQQSNLLEDKAVLEVIQKINTNIEPLVASRVKLARKRTKTPTTFLSR
jgi:hypothetical protein